MLDTQDIWDRFNAPPAVGLLPDSCGIQTEEPEAVSTPHQRWGYCRASAPCWTAPSPGSFQRPTSGGAIAGTVSTISVKQAIQASIASTM